MYIRGLIPRDMAELVEAVPIGRRLVDKKKYEVISKDIRKKKPYRVTF